MTTQRQVPVLDRLITRNDAVRGPSVAAGRSRPIRSAAARGDHHGKVREWAASGGICWPARDFLDSTGSGHGWPCHHHGLRSSRSIIVRDTGAAWPQQLVTPLPTTRANNGPSRE